MQGLGIRVSAAVLLLAAALSGCANAPGQPLSAGRDPAAALEPLADSYAAAGRWSEAASIYARLSAARPDDLPLQRSVARALLEAGQAPDAILVLERLTRVGPPDPRLLNQLGVAYDLAGRRGDALTTYRRGLTMAPGDPSLTSNLGLSLALSGESEAAIATLQSVADGPASSPRSRQNLALAYGLKGDMEQARRLSLLDLDPATAESNLAFFAQLTSGAAPAAAAPPPATPAGGTSELAAADEPIAMPATASAAPEPKRPAAAAKAADPVAAIEPAAGPMQLGQAQAALSVGGSMTPGSWLVRLGSFENATAAQRAWRELKAAHGDLLGLLTRLPGSAGGTQPVLAGPLATAAEADHICRKLAADGIACEKVEM
jgi:Flp pilus assembly protein TadD